MKTLKLYLALSLVVLSPLAWSTIYWVGSSPACTGPNVFSTYAVAEAVAVGNGTPSDEIRLTRTIDFTGGRGAIQIGDEFGSTQVTISGGYEDCFSNQSGRTFVGSSTVSSFDIDTGNQASTVILKNLILAFNDSRGVVARGDVFVQLDNVDINNNGYSGLDVGDGAVVEVLANSTIRFNENINNLSGGGVRCTGVNSSVIIRGKLEKNRAQKGGNLYVSTGCYAELKDGMRIVGGSNGGGIDAVHGGGLYVDNGGQVFADGRANRVIFDANKAEIGGAIYLNGTGYASLQNTHINGSEAPSGAAIYASGVSSSVLQLTMDKTATCVLLFGCSEIQGSRHSGSVVAIRDSFVTIQRTVIEQSDYIGDPFILAYGLIELNNSIGKLNRVGIIRNEGWGLFGAQDSSWQITHLTMANNNRPNSASNSYVYVAYGNNLFNIQNSLITNSAGIDVRGSAVYSGSCNLIDNNSNWPAGIYHIGTPQLINPAAGDARQLASSAGVDMCEQDFFAWSTDVDIEMQSAPVNENTNPQGMPGDVGGLFDVGFDEVYDNIGNDEFLLTVQKEGSGEGVVISNPAGISCGIDCSEVYFNGTNVTLNASPITGSEFDGWLNCPLVNQANQCLTSVQSSHTIRAVFIPDDLIFADGFE